MSAIGYFIVIRELEKNLRKFNKKFQRKLELYEKGKITKEDLLKSLEGWFGFAKWANTHKLREKLKEEIIK